MKTSFLPSGTALALLLAALLNFAPALCAQSATDLNEGVRLDRDAGTGAYSLKWWGKYARVYLPEGSQDLILWPSMPAKTGSLPAFEVGQETQLSYGLLTGATRYFLRLRFSDDPDYDHDGLSNFAELALVTNPVTADSDGDGIPDGWERAHGLDPSKASDAGTVPSGGNQTFLDLYSAEQGMLNRCAAATLPAGIQLVMRTSSGSFRSVKSTGEIGPLDPP